MLAGAEHLLFSEKVFFLVGGGALKKCNMVRVGLSAEMLLRAELGVASKGIDLGSSQKASTWALRKESTRTALYTCSLLQAREACSIPEMACCFSSINGKTLCTERLSLPTIGPAPVFWIH